MRKKINELLSPVTTFDILAIISFILLGIFAGVEGMIFGLIMSVFLVLHLVTLCHGTNSWSEFVSTIRGNIHL